jgi:uncharacterized damage-inducible protein DinB
MTPKLLAFLFDMNGRSMDLKMEGISHEASLKQPTSAGNCNNWVIGHIVANRNSLHELLGLAPAWDSGSDRYDRESRPITDPSDAEPLEALLDRFRASQVAVAGALGMMDESRLATPADGGKPLALQLAFLAFHETYHVGQLGLLRRLQGLDRAI